MATIVPTITGPDNNGMVTLTWETLTDTDDGDWVPVGQYSTLTAHSDGSYTGTGSITMQGSNNGVAAFPLTDLDGTAISLTSDAVGYVIAENPKYIRPLVVSGDGSTDIDVTVVGYAW